MLIEDKIFYVIKKLQHIEDKDLLSHYVRDLILNFKKEIGECVPGCSFVNDTTRLRKLLNGESQDEEDVEEGASD